MEIKYGENFQYIWEKTTVSPVDKALKPKKESVNASL